MSSKSREAVLAKMPSQHHVPILRLALLIPFDLRGTDVGPSGYCAVRYKHLLLARARWRPYIGVIGSKRTSASGNAGPFNKLVGGL